MNVVSTLLCWTMIALSAMCMSGCTHMNYKTTTQVGVIIEASVWSFLWDRSVEKFAFDYEKGTLTIGSLTSTPDKKSIKNACGAIVSLAETIPNL